MKLFRRLLLSLFPESFQSQGTNPLGMFIGFISPKEYFSVVHRRIVENYKLNLFDIALDPFEVKIGVGEKPHVTVKDTKFYYAYDSVAHLNGWTFYSPGNMATFVTMVTSIVLKDSLKPYDHRYVTSLFITTYLFTFVSIARIRVFPENLDQEGSYQWFIKTFFSLYRYVLKKRAVPVSDAIITEIQHVALQKIHLFFMLYHFYKRINDAFFHKSLSSDEYYQWLFYDEIADQKLEHIVKEFIEHAATRTTATVFSPSDKKLLNLVLPVDIQMKYLYNDQDWYDVVDILLGNVCDDIAIEQELLPFLKSGEHLEEFITMFFDHTRFKNKFFEGAKKLTQKKFRLDQSYEVSQEIDAFMSTIEQTGSMEGVKVPDQLKAESKMMDRLINFYLTFVGGLRIGRGDNFYARIFKKELVSSILDTLVNYDIKDDALYYYGGLLYNYSKNVFYYKYAFDNVRAGNQKFTLPLKSTFKEVHANIYILKLFNDNAVNTLLQDINKKLIKLSVANEEIIDQFRIQAGDAVGGLVSLEGNAFIDAFFAPIDGFLVHGDAVIALLQKHLTEQDIEHMKDNLYTLDNWVWRDLLNTLASSPISFKEMYSDSSIVSMFAMVRETLLGLLLLYAHAEKSLENSDDAAYILYNLLETYCIDIIALGKEYLPACIDSIEKVYTRYAHMLALWVKLDANEAFLGMMTENRQALCEQFPETSVSKYMSGEDTVWLRGLMKTITYYNKRYLIPNQ